MPFDPNVVIVFGTLLVALFMSLVYAFWYQSFKARHKSGKPGQDRRADKSIGVSELEEIVRKATSDAIKALDVRVSGLESEVQSLNATLRGDIRAGLPEHREESMRVVPERESELALPRNPRRR